MPGGEALTAWLRSRVYRVRGHSMNPWAQSGDYLLLGRFYPRHARPGRVVVVEHAEFGTIVKRILDVTADGSLRLTGDASVSSSVKAIGDVPIERVIGRVLLRVRSR